MGGPGPVGRRFYFTQGGFFAKEHPKGKIHKTGNAKMEKTEKNRSILIFTLTLVMLGAFVSIYHVVHNSAKNHVQAVADAAVMDEGGYLISEPKLQKIVLKRDKQLTVGSSILVYRGMEKGEKTRIDVIIPSLDPEVTYPFSIPERVARDGFTMGQQRFRLVKVGEEDLWLVLEG